MVYNANIPQATDKLVTSQPQLLGNFTEINNLLAVNHFSFNTNNDGKHAFVTLPLQAAPPGTTITEIALYSQTSVNTGLVELAMKRQNNGPVIEFTACSPTANGWTRTPSGLLIKWGTLVGIGGPQIFLYPGGGMIPAFVSVFRTYLQVVSAATIDSNRVVVLSSVGYGIFGFQAWCGQRTPANVIAATDFFYLTIGT